MTYFPEIKYHQVGNLYRLRNWVEYGLKQSKNELGWADFRVIEEAGGKGRGEQGRRIRRGLYPRLIQCTHIGWGLIPVFRRDPRLSGFLTWKARMFSPLLRSTESTESFLVTNYAQIQKWWEIVMSAYLLVSLHSTALTPRPNSQGENNPSLVVAKFSTHPWWNEGTGWKNLLNNLRLVLQPFVLFNLIRPWLKVFPIPALSLGFSRLIALMNYFDAPVPIPLQMQEFLFSAA